MFNVVSHQFYCFFLIYANSELNTSTFQISWEGGKLWKYF